MSEKDKELLGHAAVSMSEVANFLGVTRQAIAKQVRDENRDYFDSDRLNQLCIAFLKVNTAKAHTKALRLAEGAAKYLGIEIALEGVGVEPRMLSIFSGVRSKEFWIFSDQPLELDTKKAAFLELMREAIFPDPERLVVYFVPSEQTGQELASVFMRSALLMSEKKLQFKAKVFIIETNAAICMPHILICDPGSICIKSDPRTPASGYVLVVGRKEDVLAEIPPRVVLNIIRCVQTVGLGQTSYERAKFFPGDKEKKIAASESGIYFKKIWTSKGS